MLSLLNIIARVKNEHVYKKIVYYLTPVDAEMFTIIK